MEEEEEDEEEAEDDEAEVQIHQRQPGGRSGSYAARGADNDRDPGANNDGGYPLLEKTELQERLEYAERCAIEAMDMLKP